MKALEVTDEFGLHLAELTLQVSIQLDPLQISPNWSFKRDGALPVRQLASVLLKQYIDVHWSPDAARCQPLKYSNTLQFDFYRFRPPEAPQATKAAIRAMLPHGLKESISKVSPFQVL